MRIIALLTFPAYGTWLPGAARGWVDPGHALDVRHIPEPDSDLSARRRRSLKWPAVRLDDRRRHAVLADLARIADLRRFRPLIAVAAPHHVHLLLDVDDDRDIPRLVQLIKGALSRRLTVDAGDEIARSTSGRPLIHHKWWTRQYSFLRVPDTARWQSVERALLDHVGAGAAVRSHWTEAPPVDID